MHRTNDTFAKLRIWRMNLMEKATRCVVSLSFASLLLAGGLILSGCSESNNLPPTKQPATTVSVATPTVVRVETPTDEPPATQAPEATTAVTESAAITEAASPAATANKVTIENVTFSSNPILASSWSGGLVEGSSNPNPFTGPRHIEITATTETVHADGAEPSLFVYKVSD